jgi:hypothetical protein
LAFVNKREIDAVALDVPACGAGGGETGIKTGAFTLHVFPWASSDTVGRAGRGCSSKILRRVSTVRFAIRLSLDEDEDEPEDDDDDSSIGDVIGRWKRGDLGVRRDDDSAEDDLVMGSDRRSSIDDLRLVSIHAMELDAR